MVGRFEVSFLDKVCMTRSMVEKCPYADAEISAPDRLDRVPEQAARVGRRSLAVIG